MFVTGTKTCRERFINRLKRRASVNNLYGRGREGRTRQLQLWLFSAPSEKEAHLGKVSPPTRRGQGPRKEQAEIDLLRRLSLTKSWRGVDIQKK